MRTVIDIIESEIIDRYGEYKGERVINPADPMMAWCDCLHDKTVEPDYIIHCSRYMMEAIYETILSRGFQLVSCITEEPFHFKWEPPEYIRYQLPKIGVIHVVPSLTMGYMIDSVKAKGIYRAQIISKVD